MTHEPPNAPRRKRAIDWMTLIIMIIGLALALNAVIAW